jgi:hypothetical protein
MALQIGTGGHSATSFLREIGHECRQIAVEIGVGELTQRALGLWIDRDRERLGCARAAGLLFHAALVAQIRQFGFYSVLARLDVTVDYAAIERRFLEEAGLVSSESRGT